MRCQRTQRNLSLVNMQTLVRGVEDKVWDLFPSNSPIPSKFQGCSRRGLNIRGLGKTVPLNLWMQE